MNSQGYTKDNIHKGNTKIIAGGIDVDGLIRIGDQSAGGDGYVLPSVKGTEGQVLTMNADNTSSFQDVSSGTTGRIIKNLFTMIDPNTSFGATLNNVYSTGYGSLDLGSIDNFPVGATIHIYTKGEWKTPGISFIGTFFLKINDGDPTSVSTGVDVPSMSSSNQRLFYNDLIIQRTAENEYKIKGTGLTSVGNTSQPSGSIIWTSNTFSPSPAFSNFNLRFGWITNINTFYPLTTTFIVDMILDSSLLIDLPPAPTSHTALTDLTAGDAGHTQFPLLQGRPLGQTISGGITPSEFLTLKSHTAGTNNIVVKDLNTTFEKDIDMAQRLIQNCSGVINPTATTGIAGTSSSIGESTTDMSMIFQSNQASIQQLANQIIRFEPTVITASKNINIGTNQILDGVNNIIDFIGGDMTLLNTSLTNRIVVASQNDIDILANNQIKLGVPNASSNVVITSTDTSINQDLNMNDNEILQCNNIRTNTSPIFTINKNGSNATEIYGNSTIRRVQISNGVYLLTGTDLFCGNNDINDAGNVNISGSDNITLPIVIGTPSGALQVQNGGAYIKQDLQVDGSIYCDSINNIRPSGGLYSESSGFNIPSTNLTETNLLGQGGSSGTLVIPSNTFSQFDSYSFKASGVLSGGSNDTATLRLKSLVNGTTPVELGSIGIQLTDNGLVDVAWKVEADFNVRTLGGAGVGVLVLNGNFAYTNNNDVLKTYLRTIVNNTVFDTTQSNELQFTYENDGTNPLTNIRIDQASFTKWY